MEDKTVPPNDNPQFAMRNPQFKGRPTWAEVDLDALVHNYYVLCSLATPEDNCILRTANCELKDDAASPAFCRQTATESQFAIRNSQFAIPRLIPVIKANAYGHGAVEAARVLASAGANAFAVALVEEGIALREAGLREPILVLEGAWPGEEAEIVRCGLAATVHSVSGIRRLAEASSPESPVPVHLKIDTGMARLGAPWDDLGPVIEALENSPGLRLTGTFSHLACSEEDDPSYTREQVRRLETALEVIRGAAIDPGEIHLANSGGWIHHPSLRGMSARPGIALYGYPPAPERCSLELKPVMTLKTRIGCLRTIQAGSSVGYNRRFVAGITTRTAILPIGYADGYRRDMSGKAHVIIHGRPAPVLGTISMDMIVIDVSSIPEAAEGDEVILLGNSPHFRADASAWAEWAGTIPYEILCGLGSRIPRIYSTFSPSSQVSK